MYRSAPLTTTQRMVSLRSTLLSTLLHQCNIYCLCFLLLSPSAIGTFTPETRLQSTVETDVQEHLKQTQQQPEKQQQQQSRSQTVNGDDTELFTPATPLLSLLVSATSSSSVSVPSSLAASGSTLGLLSTSTDQHELTSSISDPLPIPKTSAATAASRATLNNNNDDNNNDDNNKAHEHEMTLVEVSSESNGNIKKGESASERNDADKGCIEGPCSTPKTNHNADADAVAKTTGKILAGDTSSSHTVHPTSVKISKTTATTTTAADATAAPTVTKNTSTVTATTSDANEVKLISTSRMLTSHQDIKNKKNITNDKNTKYDISSDPYPTFRGATKWWKKNSTLSRKPSKYPTDDSGLYDIEKEMNPTEGGAAERTQLNRNLSSGNGDGTLFTNDFIGANLTEKYNLTERQIFFPEHIPERKIKHRAWFAQHHRFTRHELDYFPDNCGDASKEQGERFRQDIRVMEERYQGRWDVNMLANYCWCLKGDVPAVEHRRNSLRKPFLPH